MPSSQPRRIIVQKFGGTSVSTAEKRAQVRGHVSAAIEAGLAPVVVVSAMGRSGDPYATDTLLNLLRDDGSPVAGSEYDMIYVCGEMISVAVSTHEMKANGIAAVGLNGAQAGITTDAQHTEATVTGIDTTALLGLIDQGLVPVVGGSQGASSETGAFTTLGRGGSDVSAVALGAYLGVERVEIYTDVEGVLRTDPRQAPDATMMAQVEANSMYEMARYGAGVIHPKAVKIGRDAGVDVVVKATGSDRPGTVIGRMGNENDIVGVASLGGLDQLTAAAGSLGPDELSELENSQLIMSCTCDDSGRLLLAASAEKTTELAQLADRLGARLEGTDSSRAWVSAVGTPSAIEALAPSARQALDEASIDCHQSETRLDCDGLGTARLTLVVDAASEAAAVRALYALL